MPAVDQEVPGRRFRHRYGPVPDQQRGRGRARGAQGLRPARAPDPPSGPGVDPRGIVRGGLGRPRGLRRHAQQPRRRARARLLGDSGELQQTIQTIRGRGYQFIAPVDGRRERRGAPPTARAPAGKPGRTGLAPAAGPAVLLLVAVGLFGWRFLAVPPVPAGPAGPICWSCRSACPTTPPRTTGRSRTS